MLAEDLKTPKGARKPQHKWVGQKKKETERETERERKREKESE